MRDKLNHTLADLLEDESFMNWIRGESEGHSAFWDTWIRLNPDNRKLVEKARAIILGLPFDYKPLDVDQESIQLEWDKLQHRVQQSVGSMPEIREPIKKSHTIWKWGWRIAASLVFFVALGFLIQQYAINPMVTHQTPFGQQLSVVLSDGTLIDMNANSKVSYRKQEPRKVWLDGEAFFQVRKKPLTGAPFKVITNDLTVEVLGTAFNVVERKYRTEVILEEGKVKLDLRRDFESELYMEPGDLVTFSAKSQKKVEKRQVQPGPLTSWKDGILQFEDVPVIKVMQRIEDIYGWRAIYQDENLQTRNISIPLPSNDLESVLMLLNQAIGIEIEKLPEDKVLLLY